MKCKSRILAAAVLLFTGLGAQAELANAIQAVIHDAVVTYFEVELLTDQTSDVLVRQYRSQPEVLNQKRSEMRAENLEKLMQNQLILHNFKTAGYSLPESVIDDLVQDRIRTEFGDRASMTKYLEARGLTYEKFRRQVRERFIIQQLRLKNIAQEIVISPYKVETYYTNHREEFKVEDQVKLRMIVLNKSRDEGAPSTPEAGRRDPGQDKGRSPVHRDGGDLLPRLAANRGRRLGLGGKISIAQRAGRRGIRAQEGRA